MKIGLVTPYDPKPRMVNGRRAALGGVERVFEQVAIQLAHKGHEVTVVTSTDGPRSDTVEDGIRMIREPRRATILRAPVAPLASCIPSDLDVVQVAATYPFTTGAVLRHTDAIDIPCVLDFHFEPDPGTAVGRAAATLYRRIGPSAFHLADSVMVRSYAYGRSAPSLASVPEEQWRIVPNGIDPERFHADGTRRRGGYLLFVGRLVPYKGLATLLKALARVPDAPPLYVAGDGPLRRELETMARTLGVDARFLGRVRDEDLPGLYRNARLTVLPSVTRQEAFGISLIESMACGTPVVASDLPGVADVARVGGLVSRRGDVDELAATLLAALEPGALPRGPALSDKVHAAFSWEAVAERMLDVYREVLGEGPAVALGMAPGSLLGAPVEA